MEMLERSEATVNDQPLNVMPDSANVEPEKVAVEAEETTTEVVADGAAPAPVTKETLLAEINRLCEATDEEITTDEINRIKQQFYQLHNEELRRQMEEFLAAGGVEAEFVSTPCECEDQFKTALNTLREKKAAQRAELEAARQANYDRKRAIIDELLAMSTDTDNVNRHYTRARDLQAEFKTIGEVAPEQATDIWKAYQEAVERFYDQWKVNKELRDYDFKKNLAEKQLLIQEALRLTEEPDVILAFRRLQELHDKWRTSGPVAKEIREEIWQQFKDASAIINKRYQAYFEERKAQERDNELAKTAICERMEALDFTTLNTYTAWDKMTKLIIEEQEGWKKLGYASKKANNALFARFRAVCDAFFTAKAEFYQRTKKEAAENVARKTALCERAEALQESTEWKKTADEIAELQKEWKAIGPVPKKQNDALWRRFITACDNFYDRRKKNSAGTRKTEQANLRAKQEIIAALKALENPETEIGRGEAWDTINELRERWQQTGHVPFREKDKIYEAYRAAINAAVAKYTTRGESRRGGDRGQRGRYQPTIDAEELANMSADDDRLYRERERLARAYEQLRGELQTYENNLGFFNAKSKSGNSMLAEMERKIEKLKEEIASLAEKIALIDAKL